MVELKEGIYKLAPIYHNGEIKPKLIVRFVFLRGVYHFILDNNLFSIIQKCYQNKKVFPGIMIGTRHFHNIYMDNDIKSIKFTRSLDDITTKHPELFDINSNAHLKVVNGEKIIGGTTFKDYSDSYIVDIDWKRPDIDFYDKKIIESSNKLTNMINRRALKDISVLGKEFELFYNEEIAKIRDKKIDKLITSKYSKIILDNTKSF